MTDWQDGDVRVMVGKAEERLPELPDASVHCVVTSPPYWGLRDYGAPGQLGLEETPEEYVAAVVAVFREVRRVLRPDGTLWLNMGDSYAHGGNGSRDPERWPKQQRNNDGDRIQHAKRAGCLKPKDLAMLPAEVALALRRDGWWLRADVIWAKPNPMPESVTDRPTTAHEHVFLFAKTERYFYDAEAVREPVTGTAHSRGSGVNPKAKWPAAGWNAEAGGHEGMSDGRFRPRQNESWSAAVVEPVSGRNLRSVWTIATQPYPEAHFATFPEELARRCIAAGTSERGCCPECGAPWRRVVDRGESDYARLKGKRDWRELQEQQADRGADQNGRTGKHTLTANGTVPSLRAAKAITTGWEPFCRCEAAEPVPCAVLDPFAGSGTTLAVARRLGRAAIGIELQDSYLPLIRRRVGREVHQPALELADEPAPGAPAAGPVCVRCGVPGPGLREYLSGFYCAAGCVAVPAEAP